MALRRLSATTIAVVLLFIVAEGATPWADVPKPRTVSCKNKYYPDCIHQKHTCPTDCPYTCEVDCVTCNPVCNCNKPGAVCQDPRFIGADGITFYFHGKKDRDFCIVTDSNLHINAHFIGRRNASMKRDFTWVQSLGTLFDHHQLFIGAKNTPNWNDAEDHLDLGFDDHPVFLANSEGAKWVLESSEEEKPSFCLICLSHIA